MILSNHHILMLRTIQERLQILTLLLVDITNIKLFLYAKNSSVFDISFLGVVKNLPVLTKKN